jgi:hypothetical protein
MSSITGNSTAGSVAKLKRLRPACCAKGAFQLGDPSQSSFPFSSKKCSLIGGSVRTPSDKLKV